MKNENNLQEIINKLGKEIKLMFHSESSGHDIYHLRRVLNLALHLQEKEGGDKEIIAISAFLHDIHRIMQKETGKFCSPENSLLKIKQICKKIKIPKFKLTKILHCIEFHEQYDFSEEGKTTNDIETLILQDADNLDALGAIGIGRTFTFGGLNKLPLWKPERPFDRETFDESKKDYSTIHHFYSKLLKLKDNMNTKTALKMASKRHKFMECFLDEFFKEWKGEY